MMLKDGTEDGTGEVGDGTAKTGVVKNQDGRCLDKLSLVGSSKGGTNKTLTKELTEIEI